jgi:UDP-glucuronate 4-epimerase
MQRDFTYVDDVVEGVARVLDRAPTGSKATQDGQAAPNPATSHAPYRVYNIGNGAPVGLMDFIEVLEEALGREAEKEFLPMQPGDVRVTYADTEALAKATGFAPSTPLSRGVARFVEWYRRYNREVA